MRISIFVASLICLFSISHAQNCQVPNSNFQVWDSVRLEHPFQNDSLDFFWPEGWQPFFWNGVFDYIEPFTPGAGGVGDTALSIYSTEFDANTALVDYCDARPTRMVGKYYHDGVADDTLFIASEMIAVDTSGFDGIDSVFAAVFNETVPYTSVAVIDTFVIGGPQSFSDFDFNFKVLDANATPSITLTYFNFRRGNIADGVKANYALDDINFLFFNTDLEALQTASASINLYPNPASASLAVDIDKEGSYDLELVNLQGQSLWRKANLYGKQRIDVSGLPSGLYVALFRESDQRLFARKQIMIK